MYIINSANNFQLRRGSNLKKKSKSPRRNAEWTDTMNVRALSTSRHWNVKPTVGLMDGNIKAFQALGLVQSLGASSAPRDCLRTIIVSVLSASNSVYFYFYVYVYVYV